MGHTGSTNHDTPRTDPPPPLPPNPQSYRPHPSSGSTNSPPISPIPSVQTNTSPPPLSLYLLDPISSPLSTPPLFPFILLSRPTISPPYYPSLRISSVLPPFFLSSDTVSTKSFSYLPDRHMSSGVLPVRVLNTSKVGEPPGGYSSSHPSRDSKESERPPRDIPSA